MQVHTDISVPLQWPFLMAAFRYHVAFLRPHHFSPEHQTPFLKTFIYLTIFIQDFEFSGYVVVVLLSYLLGI